MKILCVLCILPAIVASAQTAEKVPLSPKKWPTVLRGRGNVKVQKPKQQKAPYIYTTKRFKFVCNRKIDSATIAKFATTAESVSAAVSRVPLPLLNLAKSNKPEAKTPIYIAISEEEYLKLGGSKGSAGRYEGRSRSVLLKGDKFIFTKRPNYRLLVHELVHHAMHGTLAHCNAWFSEGNAEYFSAAFFGTSSYDFTDMTRSIRYRTKMFYPDKNATLELPNLKLFVTMGSREWTQINNDLAPKDRYNQYAAALVTVHYFYHIDPSGRAKIRRYLAALQEKDSRASAQDHLFPDADISNIQHAIEKYWKSRSIKIEFQQ